MARSELARRLTRRKEVGRMDGKADGDGVKLVVENRTGMGMVMAMVKGIRVKDSNGNAARAGNRCGRWEWVC
jgi:hypothetical protein